LNWELIDVHNQEFAMKRPLLSLIVLVVSLTSVGCLAVEKKTLVLVVPTNTKEIHTYTTFEGISVVGGGSVSYLESAKSEINQIKEPDFSFFKLGIEKESPLRKVCRFENTRFFLHSDPTHKRPLCMDRGLTITDRDQFFRFVNQSISEEIVRGSQQQSEQEFLDEIKKFNAKSAIARGESPRNSAEPLPAMSAMSALLELFDDVDLASIKRFNASAKDGFHWIHVDSGQILVVLPVTPACAKRIATSAKAKDWLKDMRTFVNQIELRANDDGLTIALGKQGQPIRFTHEDKRQIRADEENALIKHAGATGPLIIDGKAMTPERLIERFIAEKTQAK